MPTPAYVNPRQKKPKWDVVLTDGRFSYGLKVAPEDIKELPQTPSTLHLSAGGGGSASKYGDFDPTMAQLVQSDWSGGRGQENFSDDPSRFFDSQNCWTLTPNKLLPGPRWMFTKDIITQYFTLPDENEETQFGAGFANVAWQPLLGSTRYLSSKFTGTNVTIAKINVWLRRIGSPGTFTVAIYSDTAGAPNAALSSYTKTISNVTDYISTWLDVDASQAVSAATDYHLVVFGASTDNAANHWEVGINLSSTTNNKQSAAGSVWATGPGRLFYRAYPNLSTNTTWTFFTLDGLTYAVSKDPDGTTAPTLAMLGNRGKATAGGATTLTDTNASFPVNATTSIGHYVNCYIKIISGTGAGQIQKITANTATVVTVSGWAKNPDNTSEYVIYGGDRWTSISGHGLTKPVTSVCVTGSLAGTAYFAQGNATDIRRMRFNAAAGTPAHEFAADTGSKADLLYTTQYGATTDKVISVWATVNNSDTNLKRSDSQAWGTGLNFSGNTFKVGSKQFKITGLYDYDSGLAVAKEDSLWMIGAGGLKKVPIGLDSSPHPLNGKAIVSGGLFLYFNYMHSIEKLYGTTVDDIGPWQGSGIPSGRTGTISSLLFVFNWLFVAIDGGDGISSVFVYDGTGYHEIYRAWASTMRIRSMTWVAVEGGKPMLLMEVGGYFVYLRFPQDTLNPLNDSTFKYQHEAVLNLSTIDFGNSRLPKLFKEFAAIQKNMDTGTYMAVDYQLDRDIGGTTWTQLGSLLQSPEDTLPMGFGNARQIRLRLRLITDDALIPVECKATILEGYARTPVKYQYNIRVKERPQQTNRRGGRDIAPDVLYSKLREWANGSTRIRMESRYLSMHNRYVIVEPPVLNRTTGDSNRGSWGGNLLITLRDE